MPVFLISEKSDFPPPQLASPEGLLAIGGDLSRERLLTAYGKGIFPWFSEGEPVMWWSPDPRLVLYPHEIKISKSLRKTIRKGVFQVTMDQAFDRVIHGCARVPRQNEKGTWIVPEMIDAYCDLHESGFAHSVETWADGKLVGGLYGVSLGRCFFGESMFALRNNASKVAFVKLVEYLSRHAFTLIDCQVTTAHLIRFGAREISRQCFMVNLNRSLQAPTLRGKWKLADGLTNNERNRQ